MKTSSLLITCLTLVTLALAPGSRAFADVSSADKTFVNAEFSDADHGFFCVARPSFHPASAAQAWALSLQFLKSRAA